ncbi:hypothetical protein L1887_26390 [Cichorium endivia]|nr:hypothetical protein L1887_26390 [Cichorium endivia]
MPWMTSVKVDTGNTRQKPNSPRSKHSATEQRRRSKINDRFSMLRGIIPHGDQKRDKASFLLEVIEYIQFLQEKVHKYEDPYQGWNNKTPKMITVNKRPTDEPKLTNSISTNHKLKDEELIIESGKISISTMYSQGISSALTQALKTSGVDLSEANISVQIDLGKRSSADLKYNETGFVEESGEGLKRLKGITNSIHSI